MAKIVLGWIAIFLTAIWAFLSWNAYVCDIKGFCGDGAKKRDSYSHFYNNQLSRQNEKEEKQAIKNEESQIIKKVFFRSSDTELAEILTHNGQRVVVAMWKKEVRNKKNPLSFEQFLEKYRNNTPEKTIWNPRDFLPPSKEIPTYKNGSPEILEFPTNIPKGKENTGKAVSEKKEGEKLVLKSEENQEKKAPTPEATTRVSTTKKTQEFCPDYVTTYIKVYADNDSAEVEKLERFLKEYEGYDIVVDGFYSLEDNEIVKKFQAKYAADILEPIGLTEPTGNVYAKTIQKINSIYCSR